MNYRVIWDPDALDELQLIYNAAADRAQVADAVIGIGLELAADPVAAGKSRDRGTRILFNYPLVVRFLANERLKQVLVYELRVLRH